MIILDPITRRSNDPVIRSDNPIFLLKDRIRNPEFSGSSCDQVMILDPIEAKSLPRSRNQFKDNVGIGPEAR